MTAAVQPRLELTSETDQELLQAIDAALAKPQFVRSLAASGLVRAHVPYDTASYTFAIASCQYPGGLLGQVPAEAAQKKLAGQISTENIRFLMLLGDQIYADATAGMADPGSRFDRFNRSYERAVAQSCRAGTQHLPLVAMPDDHEIADNWQPYAGAGDEHERLLADARNAFIAYNLPEHVRAPKRPWRLWRSDLTGFPYAMFIADTRTGREAQIASTAMPESTPHIMRWSQLEVLLRFIASGEHSGPKFIASPSMLLPRRVTSAQDPACSIRADAWDGYPASLHAVLSAICRSKRSDTVFLSGDEHLPCYAECLVYPMGNRDSAVRFASVHSSALYAPFPFANAKVEDFIGNDKFDFRVGAVGYTCEVKTHFPDVGDGYALIKVPGDHCCVQVEFCGQKPSRAFCFQLDAENGRAS